MISFPAVGDPTDMQCGPSGYLFSVNARRHWMIPSTSIFLWLIVTIRCPMEWGFSCFDMCIPP